jgi:CXXX repeat peptide maturase
MRSLMMPLDSGAISFCHYENANPSGESLPLATFNRALEYAGCEGLGLNLIYGTSEPPPALAAAIAEVPHAAFVPLSLALAHPDAILVLRAGEAVEAAARLVGQRRATVVLRSGRSDLPRLTENLAVLIDIARRVNLCFFDLGEASQAELDLFGLRLLEFAAELAERFHGGQVFELNALTDRLLLSSMRNCEAGIEHLTVGPDGRLYLCPAFLAEDADSSVGDLESGPRIPNAPLLGLEHATLCSNCDAWQCRRCVYLSKKLTLEFNVPSRQQCVAAHLERAASIRLLETCRGLEPFASMGSIEQLEYLDPFEARDAIKERRAREPPRVRGGEDSGEEGQAYLERTLAKILMNQEEILRLLRGRREGDWR